MLNPTHALAWPITVGFWPDLPGIAFSWSVTTRPTRKRSTPAATIFQNLNGGIVLKTSSATIEDALNFFACAVEQFQK
jgi:hypothetical protein